VGPVDGIARAGESAPQRQRTRGQPAGGEQCEGGEHPHCTTWPAVISHHDSSRGRRYNNAITTATIDSESSARERPAGLVASGAPRYLLGPKADAFLVGPGATLVITAGLLLLRQTAGELAGRLALALAWMSVGPHYAATLRRAYSSGEIIRAHPWVTIAVPIVLAVISALALWQPVAIGLPFFAVYVIWAGYHYSGQSLGLSMLYPLRQGARLDLHEKRLIALPLYVSWILSLLGLFRLTGSARNPAYELVRQAYPGQPLPTWLMVLVMAVLAASFLGVAKVARARRARGVPLPWPTYAVLSAQTLWFTVGLWYPFFNITLVPIFHSLQYLAITSWHASNGKKDAGPRHFAGYLLSVLVLGFLITPGTFLLADTASGGAQDHLVFAATAATFINLHHFLLDGRIWRMRERKVAQSLTA
jgi:hypothetical protein